MSNLGILNPTIGGSYSTWGTLNDANMARLEKFAGSILTLSDTSGTVVLTQDQSNNAAFKFDGGGATTVTVHTLDSVARYWIVNNARASGSVTFRNAAGGTSVTLAAGDKRWLYSDGTDIIDATLATLSISGVSGLQAALDAKQTLDASLTAYAALTTAADKGIYFSGADTPVTFDLTSFGRAIGGYASEATFKAGVNLEANTDFYAPGGTDVAVADGGTNLSSYTAGDMIYASATTTLTKLAKGTALQVLAMNAGATAPEWTSSVAKLDVEDQVITGGATVTPKDLGTISSGTVTVDFGDRPMQKYVNGGAHTLTFTGNGSCVVGITNNASAGTITPAGFNKTIGAFDTTSGSVFICTVVHMSGVAGTLTIQKAV